jgi:hypothetical protein
MSDSSREKQGLFSLSYINTLELEAAFKGNYSKRGLKRSNESGIHHSTGRRAKTNTGNINGGGSRESNLLLWIP